MRRRRRWLLPLVLLPTTLGAATLVWNGSALRKQSRPPPAFEAEAGWSTRDTNVMPRAHAADEGQAAGRDGLLSGFDSASQCHRPRAPAILSGMRPGHPSVMAMADADEHAVVPALAQAPQPDEGARSAHPHWDRSMRLTGQGGMAGGGRGAAPGGSAANEPGGSGEQRPGAGFVDEGSNDGDATAPATEPGEDANADDEAGQTPDGETESAAGFEDQAGQGDDRDDDRSSRDEDADDRSATDSGGDEPGHGSGNGREDDHGGDEGGSVEGHDEPSVPSYPEWPRDPEGPHVQVPEPGTLGLLMLGLLGCMTRRRRIC